MQNILKQSTKVLTLYYTGRILTFISTVYLLPGIFSSSSLGLYSGLQAIAFTLAKLDLNNAVIRYFARLQKKQQNTFFTWILIITTFLYWLIATPFLLYKKTLIYLFDQHAPEMIDYVPISILLGYIILLNVTIKAFYIAIKRPVWPNFLQHVILPLAINLNIIGHYLGLLSFKQMLLTSLLPYIINLILLIGYLNYIGQLSLDWQIKPLNRSFVGSFIIYSLFTILGTNLILMLTRIDTIMILSMCSKEEAGLYRTVAFVALLLNAPAKALNQVTFGNLADMLARNAYYELTRLYKKITLYQGYFSSFILTTLYATLPYALYALPAHTYLSSQKIFILLALGEFIYNLFNTSHAILLFSKYFKLNILTLLSLLLAVIANYVMIHTWGIVGAAGATLLALFIAAISTCWLVWRKLYMHPLSFELTILLLITLTNIILQTYLPITQHNLFNTSLRLFITFIIYISLALYKNFFSKKFQP